MKHHHLCVMYGLYTKYAFLTQQSLKTEPVCFLSYLLQYLSLFFHFKGLTQARIVPYCKYKILVDLSFLLSNISIKPVTFTINRSQLSVSLLLLSQGSFRFLFYLDFTVIRIFFTVRLLTSFEITYYLYTLNSVYHTRSVVTIIYAYLPMSGTFFFLSYFSNFCVELIRSRKDRNWWATRTYLTLSMHTSRSCERTVLSLSSFAILIQSNTHFRCVGNPFTEHSINGILHARWRVALYSPSKKLRQGGASKGTLLSTQHPH